MLTGLSIGLIVALLLAVGALYLGLGRVADELFHLRRTLLDTSAALGTHVSSGLSAQAHVLEGTVEKHAIKLADEIGGSLGGLDTYFSDVAHSLQEMELSINSLSSAQDPLGHLEEMAKSLKNVVNQGENIRYSIERIQESVEVSDGAAESMKNRLIGPEVHRIFSLIDGHFLAEPTLPRRVSHLTGKAIGVLTGLPVSGTDGPDFRVEVVIVSGSESSTIPMVLERFLSAYEYSISRDMPLSFHELAVNQTRTVPNDPDASLPDLSWLWLYRDALYAVERAPKPSEIEILLLRIKALHFQKEQALSHFREQVADLEAT